VYTFFWATLYTNVRNSNLSFHSVYLFFHFCQLNDGPLGRNVLFSCYRSAVSCCVRMNLLWFLLPKTQREWTVWQTGDPILSHNWGRLNAETGLRWLDVALSVSKKAVETADTRWASIENQWRSTNKFITGDYCTH